ncbi:MAG: hypothetical protein QNJ81_09525 [Acidimicrobiia bacterium]|nr:hypothetical protein [Acidimicrobiia bacterium]
MKSYRGSLKIAATDDVVDALFDVEDQHLAVSSGGEQLGSWPLHELELDDTGTAIHLELGGEEVVVNVVDHDGFVAAITPAKRRGRHARPRRERRNVLHALRPLFSRATWRNWLSLRVLKWVIACTAVMGVAGLALFATESFGVILILLGMAALVIAALAISEDLTAYGWVPGNMSETTLVIIGAAAMAVGALLMVVG